MKVLVFNDIANIPAQLAAVQKKFPEATLVTVNISIEVLYWKLVDAAVPKIEGMQEVGPDDIRDYNPHRVEVEAEKLLLGNITGPLGRLDMLKGMVYSVDERHGENSDMFNYIIDVALRKFIDDRRINGYAEYMMHPDGLLERM